MLVRGFINIIKNQAGYLYYEPFKCRYIQVKNIIELNEKLFNSYSYIQIYGPDSENLQENPDGSYKLPATFRFSVFKKESNEYDLCFLYYNNAISNIIKSGSHKELNDFVKEATGGKIPNKAFK